MTHPDDIFLPFPYNSPLIRQKMRGSFLLPIEMVIEMIIGVGAKHQNSSKLFQNLIKTPIDVYILTIDLDPVYQCFDGKADIIYRSVG